MNKKSLFSSGYALLCYACESKHNKHTKHNRMGIHSDWVSIMKGEASDAFMPSLSPSSDYNVRGAFIDGQIQLMKADGIRTWDQFFQVQYANPILKLFKEGPEDMVVILGFDNYNFVPAAKAMTQAKRKLNIQPLKFEEADPLPPQIPMQWDCAMCNRIFKTKVIWRICEVIPHLVSGSMKAKQKLIIDFMESPIEYSKQVSKTSQVVICGGADGCYMRKMKNFEEIGECDCKFPRWVDYISSLHPGKAVDVIVQSTDSDYVMIAMLHYEQQLESYISNSQHEKFGRVMLYRMATTAKDDKGKKGKKNIPAQKKERKFEYVHIPLLYEIMASICGKMLGGPHPIRSFAVLVGLSGTDFSRGTPHVGPQRLWEFLPHLLSSQNKFMQQSSQNNRNRKLWLFHGERSTVDISTVMNRVMAGIYSKVWQAHCSSWDGETFASMYECITSPSCKLAAKTKESFPSALTMEVTVRNVAWTLAYWMCAAMGNMKICPDPLEKNRLYGYALDKKGKPIWADVVIAEERLGSGGAESDESDERVDNDIEASPSKKKKIEKRIQKEVCEKEVCEKEEKEVCDQECHQLQD